LPNTVESREIHFYRSAGNNERDARLVAKDIDEFLQAHIDAILDEVRAGRIKL
jgi:hypothetical protein